MYPHLPATGLFPTYAAIGFGLGVVLGLSGVGGGVFLTPLLILWLRVQPSVAVGTALAFSLVTKVAGGWQHFRQGTVDRVTVAWLAAGSLPTSLVAALIVNSWGRHLLSEDLTRRLVLAAVLLSALVMTLRLTGAVKPLTVPLTGPALIPIGAAVGAIFAVTSVGSGSIAVAALVVATALPIGRLIGTDVVHAALMAAVTAPFYFAAGHVDIPLLSALLAGSVPGVLLGSRLAARLPQPVVKGTVLVTMWAIAARLL